MIIHMICCASQWNGVRGILFDDFFAGFLAEFQDKFQPMPLLIDGSDKPILASDLFKVCADLTTLVNSKIPFLAPPNAMWPKCILDAGNGCNFGHLVHNRDRRDIYVQKMKSFDGAPLFVCECKYWDQSLHFDTMKGVIGELNSTWNQQWTVVLVFCAELAICGEEWGHEKIGCVKIDYQECVAEWVFQPAEGDRKQLVITMETGY